MESEDTGREERALDALICSTLLQEYEPSEEEIVEFMSDNGKLSREDEAMLKSMEDNLPSKIEEWKAKRDGCLIINDERNTCPT